MRFCTVALALCGLKIEKSVISLTKDTTSDAYHGTPFFNGNFVIAAHAHG